MKKDRKKTSELWKSGEKGEEDTLILW